MSTMDEYCRLALDRWQDFCDAVKNSDEVTLMECVFLQNPLTVLLARHDADPLFPYQHIEKLTDVIRELNPLVIYLQPKNVSRALQFGLYRNNPVEPTSLGSDKVGAFAEDRNGNPGRWWDTTI